MRALTWHGKHDVRMDTVPDPEIIEPAGCDHRSHVDRDLWIGPSSFRWRHPRNDGGRHSGS